MPIRTYPGRVLFVAGASCTAVLALCCSVAFALYHEQDRTAEALREDIGSRGAAINLETTLNNLAGLHDKQSRVVEPLHEQARIDLDEIDRFADKPEEQRLARQVTESFAEYLQHYQATLPSHELALFLRENSLPAVARLREYNGREMKQSEEEHRRSLRHMAWGLAVVGGLAAVGGLVLGYGIARGLRRTIHQFLVRVQGATDLLGQELTTTVEWQRTGEPLADSANAFVNRVEQVVSKIQQRERELGRSERLAAVGHLAAGVAHEIRNPLTSIILLIETARLDPSAGGLTNPDLDLIEGELHRIERSLQTLLDFARPPKLERTAVDLAAIVQDALNLARGRIEPQKVTVDFTPPADGAWLDADRDQLRQVVLNLILNALDVMPHGGRLGLAIGASQNDDTIILAVTDSGPGISPEIQPNLFVPFSTSKDTGLGLGLVISKRIVEDHGGTIRGVNRAEGGARFEVRLPRRGPDRS